MDENVDIINAYTQQFNVEFNALVQRVQQHLDSASRFNLEASIQAVNNTLTTNTRSIASWSNHLPATTNVPATVIITNETVLCAEFEALLNIIRQKQQNPSLAADPTHVIHFQRAGASINENIAIYNKEIIEYNGAINTFKATIKNAIQTQSEVNRLKRLQKRFEPPIAVLCTQIQAEATVLRGLTVAYTPLVQSQEAAATTFFSTYNARVNYYLDTVFRTAFRIDNVSHVSPQGKATQSRIAYTLTINGQAISFDPTQNYNVKDSLSDGDKSTLALALFLAKLDVDANKANKIIIFDDPLSSFDRNRKSKTVLILKELLQTVKQVVILSHNEFFLHELTKGIAPADRKALRISENFVTGASAIEPLILEDLVENDYFKHVKILQSFLTTPDLIKKDYVLGLMRNVLEAHIRFKFYRQIAALTANQRTLGTLITTLDASGVNFRDANRTDVLTALHLINSLSCKPHHGEPMPDYIALGVDPNAITVTELAGFVQDTFTLIDNRL